LNVFLIFISFLSESASEWLDVDVEGETDIAW
jgi:hypothetical protein